MEIKELEQRMFQFYWGGKANDAHVFLEENVGSIDFEDDDDDEIYAVYSLAKKIADSKDIESIKVLCNNGWNINTKNPQTGDTVLTEICSAKWMEASVVEALVDIGASLDAVNNSGRNALLAAASCGAEKSTLLLAERTAAEDYCKTDYTGRNAFHLAAENGLTDVIALMMDKGIDMNVPCDVCEQRVSLRIKYTGMTALSIACLFGQTQVAVLLAERGADVNYRDFAGNSPLHHVVDIKNAINQNYSIPANQSIVDKRIDIINALLEKGADACAVNDNGETPLVKALKGDTYYAENILNVLIEKTDVSLTDLNGNTPLHIAADHYLKQLCKKLIAAGSDINAQNKQGETALMIACKNGNIDITRLLVKKGSDINLVSANNMTALDFAAKSGNPGLADVILQVN